MTAGKKRKKKKLFLDRRPHFMNFNENENKTNFPGNKRFVAQQTFLANVMSIGKVLVSFCSRY